jgi:hypothetical protein
MTSSGSTSSGLSASEQLVDDLFPSSTTDMNALNDNSVTRFLGSCLDSLEGCGMTLCVQLCRGDAGDDVPVNNDEDSPTSSAITTPQLEQLRSMSTLQVHKFAVQSSFPDGTFYVADEEMCELSWCTGIEDQQDEACVDGCASNDSSSMYDSPKWIRPAGEVDL